MERYSTLFFSDGKKTIDFVLVYNSSSLNAKSLAKLEFFLDNIKKIGLNMEIDPFTVDPDKKFVKVNIPRDIALCYADIFSIDLTFHCMENIPRPKGPPLRCMATPLTWPDPRDPVYHRAPDSISGKIPDDITSAERILVLHQILSRTKFSPAKGEYGIQKLIDQKILIDTFTVHDGPYEWTDSGPLVDRQLLAKYWGSPKCWYKEQPLALIEKYYGPELAFYFAWLGLYVKMLVPASAISILCVVYGLITMTTAENKSSDEICHSEIIMCPKCNYKHCKFHKLANSCVYSYVTYLFDNPATITFAIIISFWSTIFMELWERRQAVLQLRWNVKSLEHDLSMRPEFVETAKRTRISPVTGEAEPYVSKRVRVIRYAVTTASVILMLVIMVLGIFGVMIYRLTVSLILHKTSEEFFTLKYSQIIASSTGSVISVLFIYMFKAIYAKVALWLTDLENHRTQFEYDYYYIYKSFSLAFTNHYAAVFYIAFFKGRFFTHPGDPALWTTLGGISSDICDPTGCIIDMSIQLILIMLIKITVNNFAQIVVPLLKGIIFRKKEKVTYLKDLPRYERDYLKASLERYYLIEEYMDMVIQYGFVVFFVAGFPLAPVLALLNNIAEIRVDAYKITTHFRRPVPNKVAGLGAWMVILQSITYLGVVTNAIVIAFTSEFVPKEIYKHQVDYTLRGFVNTTISAYDRTKLDPTSENGSLCYYPGKRYPPGHSQSYELTTDYWFNLAMRFLVIVLFEHLVMLSNGIVAYAIPDVPAHVTERIAMEERKNKEIRMAAIDNLYDGQKKRNSIAQDID